VRRLLVNDMLSALPDHRTFWDDLRDWFDCEFVGGDYSILAAEADKKSGGASLIIRNASWFPPIPGKIPTISLLQDIALEGPMREMQEAVIASSCAVVFNSAFTASKYAKPAGIAEQHGLGDDATVNSHVIPLPVDFDTFEPGNHMGLQQALSLPDGAVIWVGSQHTIKGWDVFLRVVRVNPDIPFVAVFKDALPEYGPPNLRMYSRVTHGELAKIIGACRVGLCTSRTESQHLAGIEMGACGLPLVTPNVGTYWNRAEMPGVIINEPTVNLYSAAIRQMLVAGGNPNPVRDYWKREFGPCVVRAAWAKLIEEVE